ncbi:MAG TPA: YceK/YidQ family lipoprotein [Leptospiraceae bacterium]|nr:YceK/YidQ family lipoprotein [Leptospiraceae bacterium]HMW06268.1 YceK/YidQ family lipoprotein [Leptospiraceae bacterium]HMX33171.1 YceK/YidQ family lipoprotein [Leptospiraceae bacterium]HMY31730.1 YceK/YidQ family lipoprotein [Leptospiraceae bacterium]HMZ64523.1 YceK/YidQ family lipoprotein [Leptospiraceae bacterium]
MKKYILILILFLNQCATLLSIPSWYKKNTAVFYSGTRCDVNLLIENDSGKFDPIYLIDLPFSFLLDTVLLPISIPFALVMVRHHGEIGFAPPCVE